LILFTDKIEKFVPPRKGRKHVLRIIREVLSFEPEGKTTDIDTALQYFNNSIKKRSIAFLISDFIDEGYEKILRVVGKKHDLIGVVLSDRREKEIPKMGLVKFVDVETGQQRWLNTSNKNVFELIIKMNKENEIKRKNLFLSSRLDSIDINTGEDYVKPLVQFFKMRGKRL